MKFAEFFAGAGLVREGLARDGWECVWANDISPAKRDIYTKNFGESDFCLGDIWAIVDQPDSIPEDVFLYTASFPCTDLSVAGARAGLAGKESGTLEAFLRIIEWKKANGGQPQIIMLENVRGFLSSRGGQDVADTASALCKLGYCIDLVEINASLFTPQSRPRVFLIAIESALAKRVMSISGDGLDRTAWWRCFDASPAFRTETVRKIVATNLDLAWGLLNLPEPPTANPRLESILEFIPIHSPLWWDEARSTKLFSQMSPGHQRQIRTAITGGETLYATVFRRTRQGKSVAELRTDGIAGCLRAPRGGSSKQILVVVERGSWRARLLTPREYARLQGVRDSFVLPENANQGFFAMGDAVCVPVIEYLSEHALVPAFEASSAHSDLTV